MINRAKHLRSLIDHGYIKKDLFEEFFTNGAVENIYFLDNDAVKTLIEKNSVDFYTVP